MIASVFTVSVERKFRVDRGKRIDDLNHVLRAFLGSNGLNQLNGYLGFGQGSYSANDNDNNNN